MRGLAPSVGALWSSIPAPGREAEEKAAQQATVDERDAKAGARVGKAKIGQGETGGEGDRGRPGRKAFRPGLGLTAS